MRQLLLACSFLPFLALAEPTGTSAPGPEKQMQTQFEALTSSKPLSELARVPFSKEEQQVYDEIDTAICTAYRRWRGQGNGAREHMEAWCPTGP